MIDSLYLLLALGFGVVSMGLLALAQKAHWDRALAPKTCRPVAARVLRIFSGVGLAISLMLCLMVDNLRLATLVWLMVLTVSALIIAFTLAYRPRWLGWLLLWTR